MLPYMLWYPSLKPNEKPYLHTNTIHAIRHCRLSDMHVASHNCARVSKTQPNAETYAACTVASRKLLAQLKSTSGEMLTDRDKQMERWVKHYSELYSRETVVTNAALNAIRDLPMMEELDNEPTIEDLSKAIDSLSCFKAPGCDSIPPEVIKCAKPALLQHLHQLLCLCWNEGTVHQEMRDATIVNCTNTKATAVTATTIGAYHY